MTDEKKLSDETVRAIRAQKGKKSARVIAREFGLSRSQVEKLLDSPGRAAERPPSRPRSVALGAALVFVLAVLAFSGALGNGFVWDDRQMIVQDPTIGDWSRLTEALSKPLGHFGHGDPKGALWRPLETLTFFVDASVWGKRAFGFHLTSVLLHGAVCAAFFVLLARLFGAGFLSLAAAALYAVHPVHAESVAYIPSRGEILSGLFILLALLNYRKRTLGSLLSFAAATVSKETSLMLPALLPVYDICVLGEKDFSFKAMAKRYGPYVLLAAAYLGLRIGLLGGLGSASDGGAAGSELASWQNRFWILPVTFFEYMKMIFWPAGLHTWRQMYFPSRFFEAGYFWPFLSFSLFMFLVFRALKKHGAGLFGAFWFGAFLFPVLNLAVIVNSPVLEHWLYMPLMGLVIFALSAAGPAAAAAGQRAWPKFLVIALAAVLGTLSFRQSLTWKDEITLFERTTRYVTRDPLLYNDLGTAYAERGETDKAERAYRQALALDAQYGSAVRNLEILMRQKGKPS